MATDKYEFETISTGTTGWNSLLTAFMEGVDTYLHTYLECTLGEAVDQYDVLYPHIDNKWYKAIADGKKQPGLVIATEAGAADASIRAQRCGPITNVLWDFTPGIKKPVYLSDSSSGGLTQTKPTNYPQIFGFPISSTKILINPEIYGDYTDITTTTTTTISTTSSSSSTTS